MKGRVVNFRLTLTPTLSHKWERERSAVRLRFFVGSGLTSPGFPLKGFFNTLFTFDIQEKVDSLCR